MVFPAKDLPQEADFYQFQYIKAQELTEKCNLKSLCDDLSGPFCTILIYDFLLNFFLRVFCVNSVSSQ